MANPLQRVDGSLDEVHGDEVVARPPTSLSAFFALLAFESIDRYVGERQSSCLYSYGKCIHIDQLGHFDRL